MLVAAVASLWTLPTKPRMCDRSPFQLFRFFLLFPRISCPTFMVMVVVAGARTEELGLNFNGMFVFSVDSCPKSFRSFGRFTSV